MFNSYIKHLKLNYANICLPNFKINPDFENTIFHTHRISLLLRICRWMAWFKYYPFCWGFVVKLLNSDTDSDVYLISLAAVVTLIFRFKVLKMKKISVFHLFHQLEKNPHTQTNKKKNKKKKLWILQWHVDGNENSWNNKCLQIPGFTRCLPCRKWMATLSKSQW